MAAHISLKDYIGFDPASGFELAELVENGLPTDNLNLLKEKGLTFSEMSTVISPRTLKHRRARGENLSPEETDRAVRVASTIALAQSVFANHEKALRWLRTPNDRLNCRAPISLLSTESGGRLIETMLWQIDEGIYI